MKCQLTPTKTTYGRSQCHVAAWPRDQDHRERGVAGASARDPKGVRRAPSKTLSWDCLLLGVTPPRTSLWQGPKADGVITFYFSWYH